MILLLIPYTLAWFALLFMLNFSKSKYLVLDTQRNNLITVLHAILIPLLTFLYFIMLDHPFGYERTMDMPIRHILAACCGFYIFSTINLYRAERDPEKAMIIHHVVVLGFFIYLLLRPDFPVYYALILIPQCTAAVYHTHLIFKETEGIDPIRAAYWYNLNYYSWIIFRFVVEGLFVIGVLYYEFTQFSLSLPDRMIMITGLLFSYYFNVHWLLILLKKRRGRGL